MSKPTNCVSCHALLNQTSNYCSKCGNPVIDTNDNYCINKGCTRNTEEYQFNIDDIYCDICGKPTSIGNQILKCL